MLQNIDHYPPDQRHYHQGAAVHNGPSYPECGQIVPALLTTILSTPLLGIIKQTHYLHYTLPLVSLKQLPHFAD